MPDIPFAQLRLRFTGNSLGSMFVVQCFPSPFKVTAQSASGECGDVDHSAQSEGDRLPQQAATAPAGIGLAHGPGARAPQLSLSAVQGLRAPKLKKLSIGLPPGLSFASDRGGAGRPSTVGRALGLSNGRVVRATVHSQWLSVTLKHSVRRTSLSLQTPAAGREPSARQPRSGPASRGRSG